MADMKALLAFEILPTTTCFDVKASLAFKISANTYVF
jgi:hypothetical protein